MAQITDLNPTSLLGNADEVMLKKVGGEDFRLNGSDLVSSRQPTTLEIYDGVAEDKIITPKTLNERISMGVQGGNLLQNSHFYQPSPDSGVFPPPIGGSDYTSGEQVFLSWLVSSGGITGLSRDPNTGLIGSTSGSIYQDVPKSGPLGEYTGALVASWGDNAGVPTEDGAVISIDAAPADYYRVTLTPNGCFSAKMEQGVVASQHESTRHEHSDFVNIESFISDTSDITKNTSNLQSAIDLCVNLGITSLIVNIDFTVNDTITDRGMVNFVGSGSISGLYRKKVSRPNDPAELAFQDIIPDQHLSRFITKENPIVVVVGDSISTEIANSLGYQSSLYGVIKNAFTKANPDKNITFYNRAIGGETYFTAVGLPSSFPSWYTDQGKAWPLYIGELEPDLVIFNFGMNDSESFQSATVSNYQGLLDNSGIFTAGRPDVIYCSNLTPALDADPSTGNFGSKAGQIGRDFPAGYIRSYAQTVGAGLLDMHRYETIIRDGYDVATTSLKKIGSVTPLSGSVESTIECVDFQWELGVSSMNAANPLVIKLGSAEVIDTADRGSFLIVTESSGNLALNLYDIPTNIYADISPVPAILAPVGAFTCEIQKKGSGITILIDNVKVAEYNNVITHGGAFIPRCGDATYTGGNITSAIFFEGVHTSYTPSVINDEMWGVSTTNVFTKEPWGGNGVNHPSSIGVSRIFETVLSVNPLSSLAVIEDTGFFNITAFQNGFTQLSGFKPCRVTRFNNMVTLEVNMNTPTNGATGIAFNIPAEFRHTAVNGMFIQLSDSTANNAIAQLQQNGDFQITTGGDAWLFCAISYTIN